MDPIIVLTVLIITVAFLGESVFGFGGGLISIPPLSLLIGVKEAVTLVLVFQLFMGLLIFKTYKQTNWKVARPMTLPIIIGTIIGTLALSKSSTTFLQVFLACSILVFLVKLLFFNGFTLGHKKSKITGATAGLGGGLFQGLIGTGGPILLMYLTVAVRDKAVMRATLIYLFFIPSIIRVIISIPQDLFTHSVIKASLISFPFFIAAMVLGQVTHHKISDKYYKTVINLILFFSAVVLLLKSLF